MYRTECVFSFLSFRSRVWFACGFSRDRSATVIINCASYRARVTQSYYNISSGTCLSADYQNGHNSCVIFHMVLTFVSSINSSRGCKRILKIILFLPKKFGFFFFPRANWQYNTYLDNTYSLFYLIWFFFSPYLYKNRRIGGYANRSYDLYNNI